MINKKYKTSRIIPLWFQVFFYSVLFTVIMHFMSLEVSGKLWVMSFFPASTGLYWYFSAYVGLFFLMPFINKALNQLSKKQFSMLCIVLVAFFSVINMAKFTDVFATYKGYDVFWLCIMYVLGAYVKQFNPFEKANKTWFLITYVISSTIAFVAYAFLAQAKDRPFKGVLPDNLLLTYTSPMIVLAAFSLLIFCTKINLRKKISKKIVTTLSSLSFGVYIIHLHKFFWIHHIQKAFAKYSELEPLTLLLYVIITATIIFVGCAIIEWVRDKLFTLLKINKIGILIGDKIDSKLKLGL